MQVSLHLLKLLADHGDEDATFALISYDIYAAAQKPVEAFFTGNTFIVHMPKEEIPLPHLPHYIFPKRSFTLVGMSPASSNVIIQDNDGMSDDDE